MLGEGGALPTGYPPYLLPLVGVSVFLVSLAFGGPLGEAMGWRGVVLPGLLARRDPFSASVILGALWGCWHLPLFWIEDTNQASMPRIPFLPWVMALAIIFTAVYRRTDGSLLIAFLLHTSVNVAADLFAVLPDAATGREEAFAIYVGLIRRRRARHRGGRGAAGEHSPSVYQPRPAEKRCGAIVTLVVRRATAPALPKGGPR